MEKLAVIVAWLPTAEESRDNTMNTCLDGPAVCHHQQSL